MRIRLLHIVLVLGCQPLSASGLPGWVNEEAARAYAEAALIEWSSQVYPILDRTRLNHQPAVLARTGSAGEKVVLVVYESAVGSYVVTLAMDQDDFLRVLGRGVRIDKPHEIIAEFYAPGFDPSSLFKEG